MYTGNTGEIACLYERMVIRWVGHDLPQEAPEAFADAVLSVAPGRGPAAL